MTAVEYKSDFKPTKNTTHDISLSMVSYELSFFENLWKNWPRYNGAILY